MPSKEPIMQVLSAAIESVANKALSWSNNGSELLAELTDKTCIIHVQELNRALLFRVTSNSIVVGVDEDGNYSTNPEESKEIELDENECWVSISIFALEQLKQKSQLTKLIKTGQLDFAGDLSILQAISNLFANIDLDVEEVLSKYVGDVAAYQINTSGKKISAHVKKQLEIFKQTFADAALDEKPVGVRKIMLVNFCDEVSELEKNVKRVEARMNKLFANMENKQ